MPPRAPLLATNERPAYTQSAVGGRNSVIATLDHASSDVTASSQSIEEDTAQFLNRMVAEGKIPAYSLANISTHPCIVLTQSPGWNAKKLEEHIWDVMLEQDIDNWEDHRYHVLNWSKEANLPFPWNIKADDRPNPEDFCPDDTTAPPAQPRNKCLTCKKETRKCRDPRTGGRCTTCWGSKAITEQAKQKKSGQRRVCYWPQPPVLLYYFDTVKLFHPARNKEGKLEGAWWTLKATRKAIGEQKAIRAEAAAGQPANTKPNNRKRRHDDRDHHAERAVKAPRRSNQLGAQSSSRARTSGMFQRVLEHPPGAYRPAQPLDAHTDGQTPLTVPQGGTVSSQTAATPLTVPHSTLPELLIVNPALISRLVQVQVTEKYRLIVNWLQHAEKIGATPISNHIRTVLELAGADEKLALVLIAKTPSDLERERVQMLVQQSGWTYQMVLKRLVVSDNNADMVLAQAAVNCGMGDVVSTIYGYLYAPPRVREEIAHLYSTGDNIDIVPGIHAPMTGDQRDTIPNAAIIAPIPTHNVLGSVFLVYGMDYWQFTTLAEAVPPFLWLQMDYVVQYMARR